MNPTVAAQLEVEAAVGDTYATWLFDHKGLPRPEDDLRLLREKHIAYLLNGLQRLPPAFSSLDASRPWLCYWALHSLALLDEPLDSDIAERCIDTLSRCQHPNGGYGGGPGQMPHLATTYAAVMALVTVGGRRALSSIDREGVLNFLLSMKDEGTGAFSVHAGGEKDVRGCYTALAVARILGLPMDALACNVPKYIKRCQTYEGGIGGEPGSEAHGGYTYCGLAALILADADVEATLDLPALVRWAVWRQGSAEGGFQGRTNKLVDGCYSFWQGGVFPLLQHLTAAHVERCTKGLLQGGPEGISVGHGVGLGTALSGGTALPLQPPTTACTPGLAPRVDHHSMAPPTEGQEQEEWGEAEARSTGGAEPWQVRADSSTTWQAREGPSPPGLGTDWARGEEELEAGGGCAVAFADDLFPPFECAGMVGAVELSSGETRGAATAPADLTTSAYAGSATPEAGRRHTRHQCGCEIVQLAAGPLAFNSRALQAYILLCCQERDGGLRDKPGKRRDFYHTCYCLSGLSVAQHSATVHTTEQSPMHTAAEGCTRREGPALVLGLPGNELPATVPLYNVIQHRFVAATKFFRVDHPFQ